MSFLHSPRIIATGYFGTVALAGRTGVSDAMTAIDTASTNEWLLCVSAGDWESTGSCGLAELDNASLRNQGSQPWAPQQTGSFQTPSMGAPGVWGTYLERLGAPIEIGDSITGIWKNVSATPKTQGSRTYMVMAFASHPDMHGMVNFWGSGDSFYDGLNDFEDWNSDSSSLPTVTMTVHDRGFNKMTYPGTKPSHGYYFAELAIFAWPDGSTTISDPGAPWEQLGIHQTPGEHGLAAYMRGAIFPNSSTDYICSPTLSSSAAWSANMSDWATEDGNELHVRVP